MRHSRAEEFAQALRPGPGPAPARWSDVDSDPNAPRVLARRAASLRAAWRPPVTDRLAFLRERCAGKRVLDIGCVSHDVSRMGSASWLHAALAEVAERCVGVDILADGVEAMRQQGYTAIAHDLSTGLGPVADEGPFDVIVAGELIEHVPSVDMVFAVAAAALAPGGQLIVTTPNPYAPRRVRAAQMGIVWENADHILYAFPSGMAEMCERHGLRLAEAMVTDHLRRLRGLEVLRAARRRLRGRQWTAVGYSTSGPSRVQRVDDRWFHTWGRRIALPKRAFLGETFVYVVERHRRGTLPDR